MPQTTDERLESIIELLIAHYPQGLTSSEIANQLDVTRQTIHKDIHRLEARKIPIQEPERHHYTIDPRRYVKPLRLTLSQAWMLYLPLRRMVRAQLHRSQTVMGLLKRLAVSLDSVIGEQLIPEDEQPERSAIDPLTVLTDAWRDQTLVEIAYKPLNKPLVRHLIAPYWFEPAVWSDSVYVVAGLYDFGEPRPVTLKIDRIENAHARLETFDRPDPAAVLDYLKNTWGIWVGDEQVTVRLRFNNRQRQRLMETRWHPTEKVTDQADGSVLWEAQVSEPQEMVSWIRGWGPDVEVLEPASIREQIAIDADRTARLYGMCDCDEDQSFFGLRKPRS